MNNSCQIKNIDELYDNDIEEAFWESVNKIKDDIDKTLETYYKLTAEQFRAENPDIILKDKLEKSEYEIAGMSQEITNLKEKLFQLTNDFYKLLSILKNWHNKYEYSFKIDCKTDFEK